MAPCGLERQRSSVPSARAWPQRQLQGSQIGPLLRHDGWDEGAVLARVGQDCRRWRPPGPLRGRAVSSACAPDGLGTQFEFEPARGGFFRFDRRSPCGNDRQAVRPRRGFREAMIPEKAVFAYFARGNRSRGDSSDGALCSEASNRRLKT